MSSSRSSKSHTLSVGFQMSHPRTSERFQWPLLYGKTVCRFDRIRSLRSDLDEHFIPDISDIIVSHLFMTPHRRGTETPDRSDHEKFKMIKAQSDEYIDQPEKTVFYLMPLFLCDEECKQRCRFICYALWHKDFAFVPMVDRPPAPKDTMLLCVPFMSRYGKIFTLKGQNMMRLVLEKQARGPEPLHFLVHCLKFGDCQKEDSGHTMCKWQRRIHDDVAKITERVEHLRPVAKRATDALSNELYGPVRGFSASYVALHERWTDPLRM